MKRNCLTVLSAAVLPMLFSCSGEKVNKDLPEDETIEISIDAGTKTVLDGTSVLWNKDDVLTVYGTEGAREIFTNTLTEDRVPTAKFVCRTWPKASVPVWAVYDGGASSSTLGDVETGAFSAVLSSEQTVFSSGSFAPDVNLTAGRIEENPEGGYLLSMKNICSMASFTIANATSSLCAVALKDASGSPMAGKADISWADGAPVVSSVTDGNDRVVVRSETILGDGTYYAVILPGEYALELTLISSDGSTRGPVSFDARNFPRRGIVDLGVIDDTAESGDKLTFNWDFANSWSSVFAWPSTGEITASSKITDFVTSEGYMLTSSAGLGRVWNMGLYSYSSIVAGSTISLPAIEGARLSKVTVSLSGDTAKGFPTNAGAPCICSAEGTVLDGGEAASAFDFTAAPYTWTVTGSGYSESCLLKFNEAVGDFHLGSLTLVYTGEEHPDVASIEASCEETAVRGEVNLKASFTLDEGADASAFNYGFRYRNVTSDLWTVVQASDWSAGTFSVTVSSLEKGDYEFNAFASSGENEGLRRWSRPGTFSVGGELVTLTEVNFGDLTGYPASADKQAGETTFTIDGYDYVVSGQEGLVYYYKYSAVKGLYFNRTSSSVSGNACGFIKLPSPEGMTLKSIKITDENSNKTYRVYAEKKAEYDSADTSWLGSLANDKTNTGKTMEITGAVAGGTYYLCCPIFSYVLKLQLTYEN